MSTNTTSTTSFPILGIHGVLFIGLKLADIIAWSWWLVLAPFWGPFALIGVLLLLCLIGAALT